ncbi:MAG: hypothetical protein ACREON_01330 [Gemmatimonadaceae bacterium]
MTASAFTQRLAANDDRFDHKPFLATHRAMSVCAREITRVADGVVRGAGALHDGGVTDKPIVRQSPGRCIVELSPVAITVTWLCPNLAFAEDGELLVIVWRGAVAPRGEHCPERAPAHRAPGTAIALWEQTLKPVAASETTWKWRAADVDPDGYSSIELAAHCVERLRLAYAECRVGDAAPST